MAHVSQPYTCIADGVDEWGGVMCVLMCVYERMKLFNVCVARLYIDVSNMIFHFSLAFSCRIYMRVCVCVCCSAALVPAFT